MSENICVKLADSWFALFRAIEISVLIALSALLYPTSFCWFLTNDISKRGIPMCSEL